MVSRAGSACLMAFVSSAGHYEGRDSRAAGPWLRRADHALKTNPASVLHLEKLVDASTRASFPAGVPGVDWRVLAVQLDVPLPGRDRRPIVIGMDAAFEVQLFHVREDVAALLRALDDAEAEPVRCAER